MSLGSQSEANEIFAYVLRWNAWKEFNRSNEYARWEFEDHFQRVANHNADPEWYRHPGEFRCHYAYGPEMPEPTVPDGWKFLAAGVSRRAYLSPTGVVYKVQRDPGSDYQGNKGEHETAERVRKSGEVRGAYIPRTALYEVPGSWVIALEYMHGVRGDWHWETYCYPGGKCGCGFPGYRRCASAIKRELQSKLGLTDLHNENVLWVPSQRVWAVVDLGLANGGW